MAIRPVGSPLTLISDSPLFKLTRSTFLAKIPSPRLLYKFFRFWEPTGSLEFTVPNIQSAKKRLRQSLERRSRNRAAKSQLKTAIKKLRESVTAKNFDEAKEQFNKLCKMLDQTASKRIIHVNKAARTKSRLNAYIKKASAA